jgi:hypothetical protein
MFTPLRPLRLLQTVTPLRLRLPPPVTPLRLLQTVAPLRLLPPPPHEQHRAGAGADETLDKRSTRSTNGSKARHGVWPAYWFVASFFWLWW